MAYKRPRGTMQKPVRTGYLVEEEWRDRLEEMANAARVSPSVMFEQVVKHVTCSDNGVPVWWPRELSRPEELPIDSD